jgi:hypothetical protein
MKEIIYRLSAITAMIFYAIFSWRDGTPATSLLIFWATFTILAELQNKEIETK